MSSNGGANSWKDSLGRSWRRSLSAGRAVAGSVRDLIYPPACLHCAVEILEGKFCRECLKEFVRRGPACSRCAALVGPFAETDGCLECRGRGYRFDAAISLGSYTGRLREACLALKSYENIVLGRSLGGLLTEHRLEELTAVGAGLVVAVPLHWSRQWSRRFNQAQELAGEIARQLKLPARFRMLKRTRRTFPQSRLRREQRAQNVRSAFEASRKMPTGATVLLVDDIMTTGATCSESARALKRAGASRVVVVVVARSQEQMIA